MISLVIPVYNEEVLIFDLFGRVQKVMEEIGEPFEVILVDDGSSDSTPDKLKSCHDKDARFKILTLSRNFGHQAAYTAGLSYAKGNYIVMMDGDLQDPPELIAEMYRLAGTGAFDVVYGRRLHRKERFLKRMLIKCFHSIYTRLSNLENVRQVGNFCLLSRRALKAFLSLQEKNRYLPGLRSFIGFRQGYVDYSRPDRELGTAKMSLHRLFILAFDAVFSFSSLPVKVCLYSGFAGVILIFLAVTYALIGKLAGLAPLGWSSLILSIYFIGSVQLLSIGILGEYVYRIYRETQNRPVFLVLEYIE
ncbi:MAG TPA: glycosyltransferase family 2 protein [Puia sp.]|nr:glycosyltransferase family 2 protein [Puia sp.]